MWWFSAAETLPTTAPAPPCAWVPRAWTLPAVEAEAVMTSTPEEREEAAEEGVVLHDAYAFTSINESEEGSGKVGSITINKIAKFYFDENHRAVTELVEGGELTLPADYVIFAVGQKPEDTRDIGHRAHARSVRGGRRGSTARARRASSPPVTP